MNQEEINSNKRFIYDVYIYIYIVLERERRWNSDKNKNENSRISVQHVLCTR